MEKNNDNYNPDTKEKDLKTTPDQFNQKLWRYKENNLDFIEKIDRLFEEIFREPGSIAIKGLIVGSHGGTIITSKFKPDVALNAKEIVAATTSMLFISSKAISKILNDKFKLVTSFSQNYILLCILTRNSSFGILFDRKLVELDDFQKRISDMQELALKISAIIETSDLGGDIFTKIKISIPDAMMYAIITKEGLPIKVQSNLLDEARISAFISAIFTSSKLITQEDAEFTTIIGEKDSIIIHELDKRRLLAIAVPTNNAQTLMRYVLRIKEFVII
ncbi:MAG: hypothetical protein ACTSRA_15060 [Promethearchaeota archaeon]